MIWNNFKPKQTKSIVKVGKKFLNSSLDKINILVSYQRKSKSKHDISDFSLPKMNFFNPQTKDNLKHNLVKFLALNKSIKPKLYYKPPTPKRNNVKFFKEYQSKIIETKHQKLQHFRRNKSDLGLTPVSSLRKSSTIETTLFYGNQGGLKSLRKISCGSDFTDSSTDNINNLGSHLSLPKVF